MYISRVRLDSPQLDSKGTAKLADLGCSRVISEEQRLTLTMGVGSPLWMVWSLYSLDILIPLGARSSFWKLLLPF